MAEVEAKLIELGYELPPPPDPVGNYLPLARSGNVMWLAGVGSRMATGEGIGRQTGGRPDRGTGLRGGAVGRPEPAVPDEGRTGRPRPRHPASSKWWAWSTAHRPSPGRPGWWTAHLTSSWHCTATADGTRALPQAWPPCPATPP